MEERNVVRAAEDILLQAENGGERSYKIELPFKYGALLAAVLRDENFTKGLVYDETSEEVHQENISQVLSRKFRKAYPRITKHSLYSKDEQRPERIDIEFNEREIDYITNLLLEQAQRAKGWDQRMEIRKQWGAEFVMSEEQLRQSRDMNHTRIITSMAALIELNEGFVKAGGPPNSRFTEFRMGK